MMSAMRTAEASGQKKTWRVSVSRCISKSVLIRLTIAALLVIAGTACKHNKRAATTVTHRAAFDFPCESTGLSLTVLDTEGARHMATQIGVYGCDKKAVYVYYPDSDTWVLDGAIAPAPAGYQPQAHVTSGRGEKRAVKKSGRDSKKAEKRGGMGPAESSPVEPEPVEPAAPEEAPPEPS